MIHPKMIRLALRFARTDDFEQSAKDELLTPSEAAKYAHDPDFKLLVEIRRRDLASCAMIDETMVLSEWYELATADVTKVASFRRVNCRYCHGIDGEYQWTKKEYENAVNRAKKGQGSIPEALGGFGFNEWAKPSKTCQECSGNGIEKIWFSDMEELPENIKKSISSIDAKGKITFRNKDAALDNIAKYLGMFVDRKEINMNVKSSSELTDAELLEIINGNES